jgi:Zn-dependent alcohol dehydrogenase
LEDLVTHTFKLDDVEEGIKLHRGYKTLKAVVVP